MSTTTQSLENTNADSLQFQDSSTPDIDPTSYVYHRLCPASELDIRIIGQQRKRIRRQKTDVWQTIRHVYRDFDSI